MTVISTERRLVGSGGVGGVGVGAFDQLSAEVGLVGPEDAAEFEQELVDQYLLAEVAAGLGDATIDRHRQVIFEFVRFLGRPIWEAAPEDADRYLAAIRTGRGLARSTVQQRAWTLAGFFDFLISRYQGDIHALTGVVVVQPIDEFNRPAKAGYEALRIPPTEEEVTAFFAAWGKSLPDARKYLTAARDYMAASLWRRVGLRINETRILDMRDWHPELGQFGKLHVRYGKGSYGRGPKPRMVAAINAVDALMAWWLTDVRHQFGPDWADPDAPLFPSERQVGGVRARVGDEALRAGFAHAVQMWLPGWAGRLTPHGLRHFCASSLYLSGVDLKAIQELLGHDWLSTTTRYIHVHDEHVETVWRQVNEQMAARIAGVRAEASCGGI